MNQMFLMAPPETSSDPSWRPSRARSSASPSTMPRPALRSSRSRRAATRLMTVVGHAPGCRRGECITASGVWVNDRTHGVQFKAQVLKTTPTTARGSSGISPRVRCVASVPPWPSGSSPPSATHLRNHRGQPRAAEGGLRHGPMRASRIVADGPSRRRAGDHDLPALAWGRHRTSGPHLQDLWPRGHQGLTEDPYRLARDVRGSASDQRTPSRTSSGSRRPPPSASGPVSHSRFQTAIDEGHCGLPVEALALAWPSSCSARRVRASTGKAQCPSSVAV